MFFIISSTKLGWFWWNLVWIFLNKSAANNVNVFHLTWIMSLHLPCKTWNARRTRAITVLLEKVTPKIYLTSTLTSKFARFESSWLQSVRILQESVQNTHHWSGSNNDTTDEWLPQWRHHPDGPLRSQSLFQFIQISDEYFKHLLLQQSPHPTHCNQLDSNLSQFWSFFL